jgi:hypothetical protein
MRFLGLVALLLAFGAPARAEGPVVVELFTSQSCSSCPPAEAIFRDLAKRQDLVALEWHVDYWDDLSAGAAGRWRDPFSSGENTRRQRAHNLALKGEASAYTPQIIVAGAAETVGSRRAEIDRLIASAQAIPPRARIARGARGLKVIDAPDGARLRLVVFRRSATTHVGGGENHRRTLDEAHVVLRQTVLGPARAGESVAAPRLAAGDGAALLIEDGATGLALAGAYF